MAAPFEVRGAIPADTADELVAKADQITDPELARFYRDKAARLRHLSGSDVRVAKDAWERASKADADIRSRSFVVKKSAR